MSTPHKIPDSSIRIKLFFGNERVGKYLLSSWINTSGWTVNHLKIVGAKKIHWCAYLNAKNISRSTWLISTWIEADINMQSNEMKSRNSISAEAQIQKQTHIVKVYDSFIFYFHHKVPANPPFCVTAHHGVSMGEMNVSVQKFLIAQLRSRKLTVKRRPSL